MRTPRLRDERGMALAVAIFALVVIGALVAGTFYSGWMEQRTGQNTLYASQAAEAAEAGLSDVLATGVAATYMPMAIGATMDLGTASLGGNVSVRSETTRLTESLFLVRALGRRSDAAGGVLAQRSIGTLARLVQPDISITAGLTAIGKVTLTGNSEVSGEDTSPLSWAAPPAVECPATDDKAGVRYNGTVTREGSAIVEGDPPLDNDKTLTSGSILGDATFEELKSLATLYLTGNISNLEPALTAAVPPRCNTTVQNNWGEPLDKLHPCFNYFPVIYKKGDLAISGAGDGQGILLVEGNLQVQGTIDFYGPVIVTGGVNIRGTGTDDVKFYGGVIAQDITLDDSKISGNAEVNYSSCAIRRALRGSALMGPLNERAWVQLY